MKSSKKVAFAFAFSLIAFPTQLVFADAGSTGPKRYVVTGSDLAALKQKVKQRGGSLIRDFVYFRGFAAQMPEATAQQLGREVVRIELDPQAFMSAKPGSGTVQPAQSVPWGISAIQARQAQPLNRGAGVTVCVVDTGIQGNHPDLAANVVGGENFVIKKGYLDRAAWGDDNGHGTHVAGTIAALDNGIGVVGVAPDSKLFAVKALNFRGSGYLSDIADGIRSCVRNGAKVINMSLGATAGSTALASAVADASAAGVISVAATGNESTVVSYPAKYPQVLAVTAVDSSMNLAYFSNYGPEVDFAAPGVSILSTTTGSGYATYNGTSMASPHVAGVAALMISSGSLGLVADNIGLHEQHQGAGLINALKTVQNQPVVTTTSN